MEQPQVGAGAGGSLTAVRGGKAQSQRRVTLSNDLGLWVALGPVAWLWQRLSGAQQGLVEAAAKVELAQLAGLGLGKGGGELLDLLAQVVSPCGGFVPFGPQPPQEFGDVPCWRWHLSPAMLKPKRLRG